ncbi:MAG: hypothetical protein IPN70_03260 [Candidatus Moraniibacteriota bacterium]|nr:MAG: hypothetical protein IPN70_03260 [Candidatus Moranbacteria bacterium]
MANSMNLYQESEFEKGHKKSAADYGLYSLIGVIILILGVSGGLSFYNKSLQANIEELNTKTANLAKSIEGEALRSTNDTYLRFQAAKNWENELILTKGHFGALERSIVSDAVIRNYEFDKERGEVVLKIASNELEGISRQILSFRGDKEIASVRIISMGMEEMEERQEFVAEAGIVYKNMEKKPKDSSKEIVTSVVNPAM